uniref:Ovule protein n=1 Tax=Steinernema glaseri TaxID=37863 RepID=A0A1I8A4J6_9BILA
MEHYHQEEFILASSSWSQVRDGQRSNLDISSVLLRYGTGTWTSDQSRSHDQAVDRSRSLIRSLTSFCAWLLCTLEKQLLDFGGQFYEIGVSNSCWIPVIFCSSVQRSEEAADSSFDSRKTKEFTEFVDSHRNKTAMNSYFVLHAGLLLLSNRLMA